MTDSPAGRGKTSASCRMFHSAELKLVVWGFCVSECLNSHIRLSDGCGYTQLEAPPMLGWSHSGFLPVNGTNLGVRLWVPEKTSTNRNLSHLFRAPSSDLVLDLSVSVAKEIFIVYVCGIFS